MQTRAGTERYELLLRGYYMERESHGHDPFGAGTILFADFVDRWMRDYVEPTNRFSSRRSKQTAMRQYLLPAFGHLPLKGITEVVIDPFIAKWRAGGLSAKTTNNLLSVLRTCLASAVRWRLLDRLPAMRTLKAPMPGYRFLSEDESRRLVQSAPSGYWRVFIVFLLHTGWAGALAELQYHTALFVDSDDPSQFDATALAEKGVTVIQWADSLCTEQRVFLDVSVNALQSLVEYAADLYGSESVITRVTDAIAPAFKALVGTVIGVESWLTATMTLRGHSPNATAPCSSFRLDAERHKSSVVRSCTPRGGSFS